MKHYYLLFGLFIFLLANVSNTAFAQENNIKDSEDKKWELHESITNIFSAKFPKDYKYRIFPFQYNEDSIAFSAEIFSKLGNEKKSKEKTILIKAVQTYGAELGIKSAKKSLETLAKTYVMSAQQNGGIVTTNEDTEYNGFFGKKIHITYTDGSDKIGLRIFIFMTNYARVELVLTGPANTMFSYRSNDFFDSVRLFDGITKEENPIGIGWVDYESPNKVFTAKLPPENAEFTPIPPSFESSELQEHMKFTVFDPVIGEDTFYTVSSYKTNERATKKKALNILMGQHVSRFIENAQEDSISIEEKKYQDGETVIRTQVIFTPKENIPYLNTAFYELRLSGNTVIVKEVACGPKHAPSGLHRNLFNLTRFHPEQYEYKAP